ncbi:hypothetical protein V6R21_13225 [Limibacter armeniacum]|uniref:hypothetical protein n=1 Tax=Limibacter armeniacum TaxID=466084 RepID=UPI002FE65236
MILILISVLLIANYLIFCYLFLIYASATDVSFKQVVKEPAQYAQKVNFKFSLIPHAILVGGVYIVILFTTFFIAALLFNFTGAPEDNGGALGRNLYSIFHFSLPIIYFIASNYFSDLYTWCDVCQHDTKLNGYNEYLDTEFNNETCFCCNGDGVIYNGGKRGKLHKLLTHNLALHKEKMSSYKRLVEEKINFENKLAAKDTLNKNVMVQMESLIEKIEAQITFTKASAEFYKIATAKIMTLFYNHHMAKYLLDRQQEFNQSVEENNINTYIDIFSKQGTFELDTNAMADKIEALSQEIELRKSSSITHELTHELEQVTEALSLKK